MRKLLTGLLACFLLLTTAAPAFALDARTTDRDRVVVAQGETINDDMLLAGQSVVIEGTVDGDVFAFADRVLVTGTIRGNLITAGSSVEIKGTITGSVLGAAQSVYVDGRVDRSLIAAGSRVTLLEKGSVGNSLLAAGDRVAVEGNVGRGAAVAAGTATVRGQIGRELRAYSEGLTIEAPAVIGGPVTYESRREATIEPGARTGQVTFNRPADFEWEEVTWSLSYVWRAFMFTGFLLAGLLTLALFPRLRSSFPTVVTGKPWQAPLAGFLALIAVPVGLIILMATAVGIPLGLLGALLFPVVIYFGQILVAWTAGHLLAQNVPFMQNWAWPAVFLTGALLTTLVILVPGLGGVISFGALLYGLGGVYYLIADSRKPAGI